MRIDPTSAGRKEAKMQINITTVLLTALLVVGFLTGLLIGFLVNGLDGFALLALPVLIVGFLAGWLAEWYIDARQREAERNQPITQQTPPLQLTSDSQIHELITLIKETLAGRQNEIDELLNRLADKDAQIERVQAEFARYAAKHPDDLTVIKGIGRVYQSKLREAGVNTFAELAASTPDRLRTLLEIKAWQKVDLEGWIAQARALVG